MKIKEDYMDYQQAMIDLEDTAQLVHNGINAIGIMTMGLAQAGDPYADGFHAVWSCLADAERELQKHIKRCAEMQPSN